MSRPLHVAILGATGLVGREVAAILSERGFPIGQLTLLASPRSEGMRIEFGDDEAVVHAVSAEAFRGVDLAFFAAGAKTSREWAPVAVAAGAIVIDKSSAFRMEPDVPLVVPEVNGAALAEARRRGVVASPNCSTIPLVTALKPLHDAATVTRVVVATYQSVSGQGRAGIAELERQVSDLMNGRESEAKAFKHRIAFNLIPQIDAFDATGVTLEERKMVDETRKILGLPSLQVSATCVRVPVFYGHSESVNIATERKLCAEEARALLKVAPGVKLLDDPAQSIYPMPMLAVGDDATFVGRVREDGSQEHGIELFLCVDNVRKGAALNAVQIAEALVERGVV